MIVNAKNINISFAVLDNQELNKDKKCNYDVWRPVLDDRGFYSIQNQNSIRLGYSRLVLRPNLLEKLFKITYQNKLERMSLKLQKRCNKLNSEERLLEDAIKKFKNKERDGG